MTVKRNVGEMIADAIDDKLAAREPAEETAETTDGVVQMQGITVHVATDAMATGITALRNAGLDPLRLWSLKAPKDAGGTVSAVFLQAKAEIIFLHQLSSGRYVLFEKSTLAAVSGALVEDGE